MKKKKDPANITKTGIADSNSETYQSSLNVIGLVDSFPLSKQKSIYPVFEAISNSIHAIEDAENAGILANGSGRITIILHRNREQTDHTQENYPIESILIEDNGIGFTDQNFNSFRDAYSDYKSPRGGKGIGHYSSLKVFGRVEIDSVYGNNSNKAHRHFLFIKARPEIIGHTLIETKKTDAVGTRIHLQDILTQYFKTLPVRIETLADCIIEHFLVLFLSSTISILLKESDGSNELELREYYKHNYEPKNLPDMFMVQDKEFNILHIRRKKAEHGKHGISFTAKGREVVRISLERYIPTLTKKLQSEDGSFYYHGYVSADFLDSKVDAFRGEFNISSGKNGSQDELQFESGEPSMPDITEAAVAKAKNHLRMYISNIEQNNKDTIENYIDQNAPYYRLLKQYAPEQIAQIPAEVSDHERDLQLYKIKQELEIKARNETNKFLQEAMADPNYMLEHRNEIEIRLEEINQFKQSELARYVIQRHTILQFLEKITQLDENGRAYLEEALHQLVFPLKTTSDEISFEKHNLWIIDERLAFHNYLASDMTMKSNEAILDEKCTKEPDIIIFDNPISLSEGKKGPFKRIAIIEFKRPLKEHHKEEYNPLNQVRLYMQRILAGEVRKNGRKLEIGDPGTVRFFCYIVCELSDQIIDTARQFQLTELPEKEGFIGYDKYLQAYYDVIPFERLISDAQKRNQAWFRQLGL